MTTKTKPEDFERRILLMLAGHSPAIITETLYALPFGQKPTEIRIITTASGKEKVKQQLLGENNIVHQLCKEYDIPVPLFDESHIYVIAKNGIELQDTQTETDNEIAADFITTKVREFTHDENASLHVSIAGGRKTMTYYLGYAMSVFGRIQDRMSHVLVEDCYAVPAFYYPTKISKILTTRTGETFDAKDVTVMLGELPFIRLRDGITTDLLTDETMTFGKLIEIAQRQLIPVRIELCKNPVKLLFSGTAVDFSDIHLAIYLWLLQRHLTNQSKLVFTTKEARLRLAHEFLACYRKISVDSGHYTKAEKSLEYGLDTDYLTAHRSKINKKLAVVLGKVASEPYLILSQGDRGNISYCLSDDLSVHNVQL